MTQPTTEVSTTRKARSYFGAAIGIIVCWVLVNYFPELSKGWATTKWGQSAFSLLSFVLMIGALIAIIKVCSEVWKSDSKILQRISKLEIGPVKITMGPKEKESEDESE